MCKASLPPATASAQCHICHPFLTLLILPPLESAPACRPRPPADEDLEIVAVCIGRGSGSDTITESIHVGRRRTAL